ncbi:MAG: hypothetical protein LBL77_02825 [Endomicrobium sp.]|jgi:hypothetical protein|nr:hypothetical protein [Endomicrobium sp.]
MKFLKNIFIFLLIPAVLAAGYVLVKNILDFTINFSDLCLPFWIGILCYVVFQLVFYRPMKTYIFGHELSHVIVGILSGAKIKKFNVTNQSGSVVLTKNNIWITLAPYFFPVYTLLILLIYICLGWFINIKQFYKYFLFFIGFSIAFHIMLTVYILSVRQPDLKVYGIFFSHIIILAINIVVFDLILSLIFTEVVNLKDIFLQSCKNIINIYKFIYIGVLGIWLAFQEMK